MTEPLIYTTKGNLPIASLAYSTVWDVTEDYIKFTETYRLGDEVVRESAHVRTLHGVTGAGEAGSFPQG